MEAPPKVGSWRDFNRAQPGIVDVGYAEHLQECISSGDFAAIPKEIPFGVEYLQQREGKLRPFLESLGYENLMWWS